jgi:hypothetical protein
MMPRTLHFCCLVLLIFGCAQADGRWEHTNRPQELWSQDLVDCRAQASQKVRRELRTSDKQWSSGYDPAAGVTNAWAWQNADRRKREFVEDCMVAKGYRWTTIEDDASEEPPAQ